MDWRYISGDAYCQTLNVAPPGFDAGAHVDVEPNSWDTGQHQVTAAVKVLSVAGPVNDVRVTRS